MLLTLALSVLAVYLTHKYLSYLKAVKSINDLGGYRTLFGISSILGITLPPIPGVVPGKHHLFEQNHKVHERAGWDISAACSMWPAESTLLVADADCIKEITTSRHRFPKPVEVYEALSFFGRNIVVSEHDEWKRFRKISAPAFTDRNNKLVWDETMHIVMDLFENVWKDKSSISLNHCGDVTLQITLAVIGAAGFGRRISWNDDNVIPPGFTMSYNQAIHRVAKDAMLKAIVPKWATGLSGRTRKMEIAYDEFRRYMRGMIKSRKKNTINEDRHDLFTSLLNANEEEFEFDQAAKLTEDELLGNIFIFLLAGHETSAHALCFTFALLALYPEEQDTLYKHIKTVIHDGGLPQYENLMKLTYSWAVLYESLRLFPTSPVVPKVSAEDTALTTSNIHNEKLTVPVPKGQMLILNIPGLHYNPKYWEDPYAFKPSRFMKDDWNRDAFIPFSAGARACLGRKFSETESIAILTMMVLKYKITIKEEPQFVGETLDQTRERVTRSQPGLTLTPLRTPLTFTRRN